MSTKIVRRLGTRKAGKIAQRKQSIADVADNETSPILFDVYFIPIFIFFYSSFQSKSVGQSHFMIFFRYPFLFLSLDQNKS